MADQTNANPNHANANPYHTSAVAGGLAYGGSKPFVMGPGPSQAEQTLNYNILCIFEQIDKLANTMVYKMDVLSRDVNKQPDNHSQILADVYRGICSGNEKIDSMSKHIDEQNNAMDDHMVANLNTMSERTTEGNNVMSKRIIEEVKTLAADLRRENQEHKSIIGAMMQSHDYKIDAMSERMAERFDFIARDRQETMENLKTHQNGPEIKATVKRKPRHITQSVDPATEEFARVMYVRVRSTSLQDLKLTTVETGEVRSIKDPTKLQPKAAQPAG